VLDQQWVRRGIRIAIANIVWACEEPGSRLERELEGASVRAGVFSCWVGDGGSEKVKPAYSCEGLPQALAQPTTPQLVLRMWVCGLAALGCVCEFWAHPILLTALLLTIAAVMLCARRSINDTLLVVCCGGLGALAEAGAIASGAWAYTVPIAVGVPLWLPAIWGIAALFMKETAVLIEYVLDHTETKRIRGSAACATHSILGLALSKRTGEVDLVTSHVGREVISRK
jgi:hypothetical protein